MEGVFTVVGITEELLDRNDLRLMRYMGSNIVGTINQIYSFCCDGIKTGEDSNRLQNILNDLWLGKTVVSEDSNGVMVNSAIEWDEWINTIRS